MKLIFVAMFVFGCGKEAKTPADKPEAPSDKPTAPRVQPKPIALDTPFLGKWRQSQAQWSGMSMADGSEKHEYDFRIDGTYSYRREATSNAAAGRWLDVRETGTLTHDGGEITLTPSEVKATIRDGDGNVVDSPSLAPETITYRWKMHLFEGLGETQLVLTPATGKETIRDGSFAANAEFSTSYLLSNQTALEWRFP